MSKHHVAVKNDPRYKAWRAEVLERDDYTCRACGATDDVQADHIVALGNGGDPFDVDNGQALCGPCNRDKSDAETQLVRAPFVNERYAETIGDLLGGFL